jgi:hypothetical protein
MRNELDIEIYKVLSEHIKASEIFLGHTGYDFVFTKTNYQATCTEAFPFNPFDKVICEILQIEKSLSFHDIGNILGMNVGSPEVGKKLKDLAEYEILMEALQSLSEFNMIEGGDIYFSRCRLTEIGKEYATKKHKFRKTSNKPFTIYFDRTTGSHALAKSNFEYAHARERNVQNDYPLVSGDELKSIVAVQVPSIYDEKRLFSFTDERIIESKDFTVTYEIAVLYDIKARKYSFYCYDAKSKKVNTNLTEFILNNELIKEKVLGNLTEARGDLFFGKSNSPELLSNRIPEVPILEVLKNNMNWEYVDELAVLNFFNHLFDKRRQYDLYLCLPYNNQLFYEIVLEIIKNSENKDSKVFVIFDKETESNLQGLMTLIQMSETVPNFYVMFKALDSFAFILNQGSDSCYIEIEEVVVDGFNLNLARKNSYDSVARDIQSYLLDKFSSDYLPRISDRIFELLSSEMDPENPRDIFGELELLKTKVMAFNSVESKKSSIESLSLDIKKFKCEREQIFRENFEKSIQSIYSEIINCKNETDLKPISGKIEAVKLSLMPADSDLRFSLDELEKKISIRQEEFTDEKRIYSFIIDTNILLEDPEVIIRVDKKHSIIIAGIVLDELDKFKMDKNFSAIVSRAVKLIQQDKNRNIRHNKGRPKLLPPDLNQKTPDNLILSVAIQYQNNHGVLVTLDNLLAVKAKNVLDLTVMNLQEFKTKFDQSLKS